MASFSSTAFSTNAFSISAWDFGAAVTTTPAIQPAGRGGKELRNDLRKRFILPDGTSVLATLQDVQEMLEQFIVPDERPQKRAAMAKALSVRKGSEPKLNLVQFQPIKADTVKIKIEAPWVLDTKSAEYRRALEQMAFDEDEEDVVILLMTMH